MVFVDTHSLNLSHPSMANFPKPSTCSIRLENIYSELEMKSFMKDRHMNILRLLSLLVGCFFATAAAASCYVIYDNKGKITYQSSQAPVDLSKSISHEMNSRFKNRHLVIITEQRGCADLRERTEQRSSNGSVSRATVLSDVDYVLERSPLFRKRISFLEIEQ